MPALLAKGLKVHAFTDGSTVPRDAEGLVPSEDSGASVVWYLQEGGVFYCLGSIRARVRHFAGNYLPEVLGIALALRFTPQNLPFRIHFDCEAAHITTSRDGFTLSHRRRVSASARQVVEAARYLPVSYTHLTLPTICSV